VPCVNGSGILPMTRYSGMAMTSSGIIIVAMMTSITTAAPRNRLRARAYAARLETASWRLRPNTSMTAELSRPRPTP
jgi:hypothetical protein